MKVSAYSAVIPQGVRQLAATPCCGKRIRGILEDLKRKDLDDFNLNHLHTYLKTARFLFYGREDDVRQENLNQFIFELELG